VARRGTPIAVDVRQEAKRLFLAGERYRVIARKLGVSHNTVRKYVASLTKTLVIAAPHRVEFT
jgi:DNA-binding CsgD family transcriptional regulator